MTLTSTVNKFSELRLIAHELEMRGLCFTLLVNSSVFPRMNVDERLTLMGFKHGLPDILIFDYPANQHRGMALWVVGGDRPAHTSTTDAQKIWISNLKARKWSTAVVRDCAGAIKHIEDMGL